MSVRRIFNIFYILIYDIFKTLFIRILFKIIKCNFDLKLVQNDVNSMRFDK